MIYTILGLNKLNKQDYLNGFDDIKIGLKLGDNEDRPKEITDTHIFYTDSHTSICFDELYAIYIMDTDEDIHVLYIEKVEQQCSLCHFDIYPTMELTKINYDDKKYGYVPLKVDDNCQFEDINDTLKKQDWWHRFMLNTNWFKYHIRTSYDGCFSGEFEINYENWVKTYPKNANS